mmetsp:Transcript_6372/g.17817  ORF Transcript_6372/g.17817 Transcript_6372/m.17817 type:complete len:338 (-) Transcript_6372:991-2004(-)
MFGHQVLGGGHSPGYCLDVKRCSPSLGKEMGNRPPGLALPVRISAKAGPTCSPGSNKTRRASASLTHSVVTAPGTDATTTIFCLGLCWRKAVTNSFASGRIRSLRSQPSSECAAAHTTEMSAPFAPLASMLAVTPGLTACTPASIVIVLSVSTKPLPPPEYTLPCLIFGSSAWLQREPTMTILAPSAKGKAPLSFFKSTAPSMIVWRATARCASLVVSACTSCFCSPRWMPMVSCGQEAGTAKRPSNKPLTRMAASTWTTFLSMSSCVMSPLFNRSGSLWYSSGSLTCGSSFCMSMSSPALMEFIASWVAPQSLSTNPWNLSSSRRYFVKILSFSHA